MRQLLAKGRHISPANISEISAIEWAIPILEQHMFSTYGELPRRIKYYKHEKWRVITALFERDGDICYLCNKPMHLSGATIDHVMPLAKGGMDGMSNYRLTHLKCNVAKGNMTHEQFLNAPAKLAKAKA